MGIPFYRTVNYTDEGCSIGQCLSCYLTWEGRGSHDWAYCPYCGVKWEDILKCRDHYTPKWKWNYALKHGEAGLRDLIISRISQDIPRRTRGWMIEKRDCRIRDGVLSEGEWHPVARQSDHGVTTLKNVLNELAQLRNSARLDRLANERRRIEDAENGFVWNSEHWEEHRARIVDYPNHIVHSYGRTIWQNNVNHLSFSQLWKTPA